MEVTVAQFFSDFMDNTLSFSLSTLSAFSMQLSAEGNFFPTSPGSFVPVGRRARSVGVGVPRVEGVMQCPTFMPADREGMIPRGRPVLAGVCYGLGAISDSS